MKLNRSKHAEWAFMRVAAAALVLLLAPVAETACAQESAAESAARFGAQAAPAGKPAVQPSPDVHREASERRAIQGVLETQVEAWNRGDVEAYMEGYWKSDKLIFAGASGVSRGWQMLLNRYRYNYPGRQAMGQLAFSELEITLLGKDAAFVLGKWELKREKDGKPERLGGVFTLVLRKFQTNWRVISDHTSSVAEK